MTSAFLSSAYRAHPPRSSFCSSSGWRCWALGAGPATPSVPLITRPSRCSQTDRPRPSPTSGRPFSRLLCLSAGTSRRHAGASCRQTLAAANRSQPYLQKLAGFAIIAWSGLAVLLTKLDDRTHTRQERIERGEMVDSVMKQRGIPVVHVRPGQKASGVASLSPLPAPWHDHPSNGWPSSA